MRFLVDITNLDIGSGTIVLKGYIPIKLLSKLLKLKSFDYNLYYKVSRILDEGSSCSNFNSIIRDVSGYNGEKIFKEWFPKTPLTTFDENNQNTFENFNYKFDIIFLDPPYKEKNINDLFLMIFENKLLNKNGIIILHRKNSDNDMLPKEFIKIEEKTYGISKIMFFSTLN